MIPMEFDEPRKIHAVQVIAGKQQDRIAGLFEIRKVFPHRIRSSLVPTFAVDGLRRGQDRNETARESIHAVALVNMTVERLGSKLRENPDCADAMVQTITDRNVDEPEFSSYRYGRFRTRLRKRMKTAALTSCKNDRGYMRLVHKSPVKV